MTDRIEKKDERVEQDVIDDRVEELVEDDLPRADASHHFVAEIEL